MSQWCFNALCQPYTAGVNIRGLLPKEKWNLPAIDAELIVVIGIVDVPVVLRRLVSITAGAPQIRVDRPVLVPQVATRSLFSK